MENYIKIDHSLPRIDFHSSCIAEMTFEPVYSYLTCRRSTVSSRPTTHYPLLDATPRHATLHGLLPSTNAGGTRAARDAENGLKRLKRRRVPPRTDAVNLDSTQRHHGVTQGQLAASGSIARRMPALSCRALPARSLISSIIESVRNSRKRHSKRAGAQEYIAHNFLRPPRRWPGPCAYLQTSSAVPIRMTRSSTAAWERGRGREKIRDTDRDRQRGSWRLY